jgi:hypothetical protein
MDIEALQHWAEAHHYPQLVLAENDVVKHDEWHKLLSDTSGRIEQAIARISAFLERVEREKRGN